MDTPFPGVWPVWAGKFLAGPYPGNADPALAEAKLAALLRAGCRCFISLVMADERGRGGVPFTPYTPQLQRLAEAASGEIELLRFPVPDLTAPSLPQMRAILDQISQSIERDRPVYLHCRGGVGRTGTVVGCWLIEQGMTGDEAIAEIARLRAAAGLSAIPRSPETAPQIEFVRKWRTNER